MCVDAHPPFCTCRCTSTLNTIKKLKLCFPKFCGTLKKKSDVKQRKAKKTKNPVAFKPFQELTNTGAEIIDASCKILHNPLQERNHFSSTTRNHTKLWPLLWSVDDFCVDEPLNNFVVFILASLINRNPTI